MFDRCKPRLSRAAGGAFAGRLEPLGDDHGGRDERAGERAAARLIGARDPSEALGAQGGLVALEVRRYSHPHLDGGNTITNAFPITASSGTSPTPTGGSKRESPEWARLSPSTNSMPSGTVVGG